MRLRGKKRNKTIHFHLLDHNFKEQHFLLLLVGENTTAQHQIIMASSPRLCFVLDPKKLKLAWEREKEELFWRACWVSEREVKLGNIKMKIQKHQTKNKPFLKAPTRIIYLKRAISGWKGVSIRMYWAVFELRVRRKRNWISDLVDLILMLLLLLFLSFLSGFF